MAPYFGFYFWLTTDEVPLPPTDKPLDLFATVPHLSELSARRTDK